VILRRAVIAALLCAFFWYALAPMSTFPQGLLVMLSIALTGLVIGVILSWPRQWWIRVLVVLALALLIGIGGRAMHGSRPETVLSAVITVLPLFLILGLILVIDAVVAWVVGRLVAK
jgi:hypothetical protein